MHHHRRRRCKTLKLMKSKYLLKNVFSNDGVSITLPFSIKMKAEFAFLQNCSSIVLFFQFQNVAHNSKLRSKRGLLPFVELNGEEICDSDIIIKALAKKFEKDMDEGLTAEQKNVQHAMITMVQNHLQW